MNRFVKELSKDEIWSNTHRLKENVGTAVDHKYEFLQYNSAYLQKENTESDLKVDPSTVKDKRISHEEK